MFWCTAGRPDRVDELLHRRHRCTQPPIRQRTMREPKGKRPCDAGLDTIAYSAATGEQLWLKRLRAAGASGGGLAVSRLTDTVVITGGIFPCHGSGEDLCDRRLSRLKDHSVAVRLAQPLYATAA